MGESGAQIETRQNLAVKLYAVRSGLLHSGTTSEEDLFPGIESISVLTFMSSFNISLKNQHLGLLFLFFFFALIVTMIAAANVSDTEDGKQRDCGRWAHLFWPTWCSADMFLYLSLRDS